MQGPVAVTASVVETAPARSLRRAAAARGVEILEGVVVAVFLAIGAIGGYRALASVVGTHTVRIADCAGGEACAPSGTGGTAAGGPASGGAPAAADADEKVGPAAPPPDELLTRLAAADTGTPTTPPPAGGGPLAPTAPAPGGVRGALRDGVDYTLGAGHGVLRSAASLGQSITDIVGGTARAAVYTVTNPVDAANATGRAFREYGQALWNDPLRTLGAPFINGYNGVVGRFQRDRRACTSGTVFECASDSWQTATDVGSALVGPGAVGRAGTAAVRPAQAAARPAATAARVEAPPAARVIDTCADGACARTQPPGTTMVVGLPSSPAAGSPRAPVAVVRRPVNPEIRARIDALDRPGAWTPLPARGGKEGVVQYLAEVGALNDAEYAIFRTPAGEFYVIRGNPTSVSPRRLTPVPTDPLEAFEFNLQRSNNPDRLIAHSHPDPALYYVSGDPRFPYMGDVAYVRNSGTGGQRSTIVVTERGTYRNRVPQEGERWQLTDFDDRMILGGTGPRDNGRAYWVTMDRVAPDMAAARRELLAAPSPPRVAPSPPIPDSFWAEIQQEFGLGTGPR